MHYSMPFQLGYVNLPDSGIHIGSWNQSPMDIKGQLQIFIEKMSIQILCPFFNWFDFFLTELYEFFIYFRQQPFIRYMISNIFSLSFGHFILLVFFTVQKLVSLMQFFVYVCFFCLCFWCQIRKIIARTSIRELTNCIFFQEFYGFRSCIQV